MSPPGEPPSTAEPPPHAKPTGPAGDEAPSRWRTSLLVPAIIIAIVIGLIGGIVLISQQQQGDGRAALLDASVDPADLPLTLPYRDVAGYIVIDVTFGDDRRTSPMILDTGAPTIITEELAEVFASDPAGTIATTSADGQVATSTVVPLSTISIGGVEFRDVGAVIGAIEPGNPFYCITDAGFIGTSLLQTAVWQIDPVAREVTIAASMAGLDHIDSAERIDFRRASEVSASPIIEARTADETLSLLLDTGSDGWITVNPQDIAAAAQVAQDGPARSVLASGASGTFLTTLRWAEAELDLGGGVSVRPIATSDVMPERQGNIGTDFLAGHVVTIDWTEDSLYFDPVASERTPSLPMSASLGWEGGYVLGSFVHGWPGTDGLEPGTPVVTIDGRDVTGVPFDDFCSRMTAPRSDYEMTVAGEVPTTVEVAEVVSFYEPLAEQPQSDGS